MEQYKERVTRELYEKLWEAESLLGKKAVVEILFGAFKGKWDEYCSIANELHQRIESDFEVHKLKINKDSGEPKKDELVS